MTTEQETITQLEALGFKAAAGNIKALSERKRKLAIAYEHFRFVRQERISEFNVKLKAQSRRKTGSDYLYETLAFTPIENYPHVPPADVLLALASAKEKRCFDSFEVAHIETVKEDPILFGRVNGCPDRFFISQWDNDVKIEDILKANEG